MLRRLFIYGLVFGLGAATLRSQSPSSRYRYPDPVPSDAIATLAEDGLFIRILADGTVLVDGQTFDFDIGRIRMRIGSEEVKKLMDEFERINFFSLRDGYRDRADGCWNDGRVYEVLSLTMRSVTLTLNGRTKSVTRYPYVCLESDGSPRPRELVALEKQIEEAVDLKRRR